MLITELGKGLYIQDGILSNNTKHVFVLNTTVKDMEIHNGEYLSVRLHTVSDFNLIDASKVFKLTVTGSSDINPKFPARDRLKRLIQEYQAKFRGQGWGTKKIMHRIRLNTDNPVTSNAYVYGPKEAKFIEEKTRIMDSLLKLMGSNWYSHIDLESGYWQVPMHPDDIEKMAGLFEYLFMPMGLVNASFTWRWNLLAMSYPRMG